VPTFWTEYEKFWKHPETNATNLRLKILLVIGIGSSLSQQRDTDPEFYSMVNQWVYAAQTWLSGPLEKDRLDIDGLQIYCLTILARQIFSIGADLVWISMGSLLFTAMQMGLHRDPKHLPSMSVLQAELRRRLWASILEMLVQSSLDSAMPPKISFDEFDTEPPSNINDDDMDDMTIVIQPRPRDVYTKTSMQLMLLDSLQTRLQVLQLLSGMQSEASYLDALKLSSEITNAYRGSRKFLVESEVHGVTPFHRNLLDYLVRRFMIPLHSPFASKAQSDPLFHYSLKVSLDNALAMVMPEPNEPFFQLMAIGGGWFREGIRCATTIICLELISQTESHLLEDTLQQNSQRREFLKKAIRDMIVMSTERIRQGETNIKNHMFLSMILAHAEALELGASIDLMIARSAKDSLEFCYGLLETQAGAVSFPTPNDTSPSSTNFSGGQADYGLDFDVEFFFPGTGLS